MKPLITEATFVAREQLAGNNHGEQKLHQPSEDKVSVLSTQILDFSATEFRDHFSTLWSHFRDEYARTPDNWSVRVSGLGLHHKALDLALMSLATLRLSVSGQSDTYLVFSLSAYNSSRRIFQRLLHDDRRKKKASWWSLRLSLRSLRQLNSNLHRYTSRGGRAISKALWPFCSARGLLRSKPMDFTQHL
jgi:hypothetical protein